MAELHAERVTFTLEDGDQILHDVSLRVSTGELVVILGGNGEGKTTLLRILSGLLKPTGGEVYITGLERSEVRHQVGIVFQNPDHQMIAPTVKEEIALGLELRGTDPQVMRTVVEEMLRRFQLEELRDRPPEALSGGQKQRVALAAVMAAKPPFLLLDEPDSYLDAPSRRDLLHSVEEVRQECGILWVVPDPRRMPMADRYYVLQNGRLEASARSVLRDLVAQAAEPVI